MRPLEAHAGRPSRAIDRPAGLASPAQLSARRHIAIIIQNFEVGGTERMMLNLSAEVVAIGHRVDVVVMNGRGPLASFLPEGVRVFDLGCRRALHGVIGLLRYMNAELPDAVLSGLVHINTAAIFAKLLAFHRVRLVISERNTPREEVQASGSRLARAAYAAMRWSYPRADAIVAVSAGVADDLARYARLPRRCIEVVNNPVVTPEIRRLTWEEVDVPWPDAQRGPVVLGVGRLSPQKDFVTLLRAFARLREQRPCSLVILGEGEQRSALERAIIELGLTDSVALPGYTRNPYAAMRRASLFVLSSIYEGSPNVLVEAMACGTPVVATDCPNGPREILLNGALAPLVPVRDARSLAGAMMATLDAPPDPNLLIRRANDYSTENSAMRYIDILLGVA